VIHDRDVLETSVVGGAGDGGNLLAERCGPARCRKVRDLQPNFHDYYLPAPSLSQRRDGLGKLGNCVVSSCGDLPAPLVGYQDDDGD
jgi:hypothetical protein